VCVAQKMPRQYNAMSQNRYVSRKKVPKRKYSRALKTVPAAMKRVVEDVITRRCETKHVSRFLNANVCHTMAPGNCVHLVPGVIQGISAGQRIGDRLNPTSMRLVVSYSINTAATRTFPQGIFFDTYIFSVKGKNSFNGTGAPTLTDFARFLEFSGNHKQYDGDIQDYEHRVNDDIISLIYKKRELLNTSRDDDTTQRIGQYNKASVGGCSVSGPNLFKSKTWVYDSLTDIYPRNCNIFGIVVCASADGTPPVGAQFTDVMGKYQISVHMDYTDM